MLRITDQSSSTIGRNWGGQRSLLSFVKEDSSCVMATQMAGQRWTALLLRQDFWKYSHVLKETGHYKQNLVLQAQWQTMDRAQWYSVYQFNICTALFTSPKRTLLVICIQQVTPPHAKIRLHGQAGASSCLAPPFATVSRSSHLLLKCFFLLLQESNSQYEMYHLYIEQSHMASTFAIAIQSTAIIGFCDTCNNNKKKSLLKCHRF